MNMFCDRAYCIQRTISNGIVFTLYEARSFKMRHIRERKRGRHREISKKNVSQSTTTMMMMINDNLLS